MLRSILALSLVAATGAVASADMYAGLGIGTAANVDSSTMTVGSGRSGRLIFGWHFAGLKVGHLSVEAAVSRFGMSFNTLPSDQTQLTAAAKYGYPLGNGFEAFGRLGLERSWLSTEDGNRSWSGNGYVIGAGFEYSLSAILAGASIFVDYERSSTGFGDDTYKTNFDAATSLWTLGATISI